MCTNILVFARVRRHCCFQSMCSYFLYYIRQSSIIWITQLLTTMLTCQMQLCYCFVLDSAQQNARLINNKIIAFDIYIEVELIMNIILIFDFFPNQLTASSIIGTSRHHTTLLNISRSRNIYLINDNTFQQTEKQQQKKTENHQSNNEFRYCCCWTFFFFWYCDYSMCMRFLRQTQFQFNFNFLLICVNVKR